MRILIVQRFDLQSVSCARRVLCQVRELCNRGHEVWVTDYLHTRRHQEQPVVASRAVEGASLITLHRKSTRIRENIVRVQNQCPRPDLIHLWKSYPDASLPAWWLARHWNIPLHYDYDDWETGIAQELTDSAWAGWCAGLWDRHLPHCAHSISVASGFLRQNLLAWGIPPHRIWDAPVGADIERFYPREPDQELKSRLGLREPVIVYSGQLEVASYAELAVRALPKILEHHPTASLLILGGGRKLPAIRECARTLNVADHVHFTDYIPGEEIPRYLSLAQCAIAPFEENDVTRAKSPLKIVEYLAMGLPVVASDVGEAPRMIGNAGTCVPCGSIEALADGLIQTLHRCANEPFQQWARQRAVEQYNWSTHVDSLEDAYRFALHSNSN